MKKPTVPGALPDDPDPRCGVGPFSLPADKDPQLGINFFHTWPFTFLNRFTSLPKDDPLTPAAEGHDYEFLLKKEGLNKLTKEEADKRLKTALLLLAKNRTKPLGTGFNFWYEIQRAKLLGWIGANFSGFFWRRKS